ncbi:MAG TPA: SDR family oxidoreductase [Acidimicrobiales bacterium]|nr:SDR family oxidoreductase [Acidimicrobiales bacterium]
MSACQELVSGRLAVVTGGGAGIGAAVVRVLAEAGARGAVLDQLDPTTLAVPDGWVALNADVRDPGSIESAFALVATTFERVDIVVANAGVVPPWTTTAAIDLDEWEHVFAVNARGVMLTVRQAVRAMAPGGAMSPGPEAGHDGKSIIAMASLNGWRGDPHIPAYAASKHAVLGLVRSVAQDVGQWGIRVNAVAPGPIATEALLGRMTARAASGGLPIDEALRQAGMSTALGRMATADEVASTVLFLASDLSSGMTGQLLAVDAGIL